VFDRVRENLIRIHSGSLEDIVNKSLNDTLSRSINTSLTTLFVLLAIFFFGGATLQYFALALIIGILAGTYSSIFLASPILLAWLNYKKSRE
jgi:preprotein translocase subunit SecF